MPRLVGPAISLCLFVACGGLVADPGADGGGTGIGIDAGLDASDPCTIRASTYDQACTTDADCVSVFDGNVCSAHCRCPNSAINKGQLARYQSDFPRADGGGACGCPLLRAVCANGVCGPCNGATCVNH